MSVTYDCIVLGLGGVGSAALDHLARRGQRVLGIEQFRTVHDRGSSHGETRATRKAYFEHTNYVPLLERAEKLWRELECDTGRSLLEACGLFIAGPADGPCVQGCLRSAGEHKLKLEQLSPPEARRRFPNFEFDEADSIVYEPGAGYLRVEDCIRSHLERARQNGAESQFETAVIDWEPTDNGVRVRTERSEYEAARLVITAGGWATDLISDLGFNLKILRKTLLWLPKTGDAYDAGPVFYYVRPRGDYYGFPSLDGATIKLSEHTGGDPVDRPEDIDPALLERDAEPLAEFARQFLPAADPQPTRHATCFYTMSPDGRFYVDRHPEHPQVAFAAGLSGHGFKFASVLGEVLADLAIDGETEQPIGFLGVEERI
ncbi:N-methyl-L-tryptophan oxidase [Stratiformator vulcanicus]|uniref:Monomeric sarcosine oxidase n=1 Tax=Stratiformator vulcanicus TaxID=2527980 RepID=A0A517R589_9PLAN|nr:N-methyl-L-tryptophan oxidase [Stratiformator vulcanicus]QDT39010.1 Monomeric sarcosine oxidase [Stratiformator vulcanicus]